MALSILVTGSEGNIGTFVCKRLRERFPEATLLRVSRDPSPDPDVIVGDVGDTAFVRSLVDAHAVDYILHLASRPYNLHEWKEAGSILAKEEEDLVRSVLGAASSVRKIVYPLSSLVYDGSSEPILTEDMLLHAAPTHPYGMGKLAGYEAVEAFSRANGIPFTAWCPFNVVSPLESHARPGAHVFVDYYRALFIERVPSLEIYNPDQARTFLWVEDVAEAIADFLDDPRTDGQIINLANPETITLFELAELYLALGKENGLLPQSYAPELIRVGESSPARLPSTDRARDILGWSAHTPIKECFRKFIDSKDVYGKR